MDALNTSAKFEVRSFTPFWDNRGYSINLGSPWIRPRSVFSQIFQGHLFGWTLWTYLSNLKFVALPVPEIIGSTQKIGPSLDTPTLPYLPNFSWACVWMDPANNSDCTFWVGLRTPKSRERGGRRGSGMVPFERAFVTFYRPSIVTFPLSLHVSEILPLLCSSTPLFPTPPLVSPKFPHVPLGVGKWPLDYEERCWANCPCN